LVWTLTEKIFLVNPEKRKAPDLIKTEAQKQFHTLVSLGKRES